MTRKLDEHDECYNDDDDVCDNEGIYHIINAVIADARCTAGDPVARLPRPWMRPGGRYYGNDRGGVATTREVVQRRRRGGNARNACARIRGSEWVVIRASAGRGPGDVMSCRASESG